MAITTKIIDRLSDEATFIKAFIHALTAADSRITCSNTDEDIDTQFSSSVKPTFTFNVDGVYTITFLRSAVPTSSSNLYSVTMRSSLVNSAAVTNSIYFCPGTCKGWEVVERTLNFRVIVGTKAIIIIIADHNNNIPSGPTNFIKGLSFKDGTDVGFSASTTASTGAAIMGNFYYINEDYVLPVNRMPYSKDIENTSSIEVIRNKAMIYSSQALKHSQTTAFYDCSSLPFTEKEFTIDGSSYYALNANTIIPLS